MFSELAVILSVLVFVQTHLNTLPLTQFSQSKDTPHVARVSKVQVSSAIDPLTEETVRFL